MPRDPDTTLICSPEKADCIHEAIVIVEQTAFDDSRTTETDCRCLPSCSDIEYPHKYSSVELSRKELVHFPDKIKGKGGDKCDWHNNWNSLICRISSGIFERLLHQAEHRGGAHLL